MRARLLELLRVSEHPEPPPGPGDSLDVFRASRRYLYYSILIWIAKQAAALLGLLVSLVLFRGLDESTVRKFGFDWLFRLLERWGVPDVWPKAELLLAAVEGGAVVTFVGQLLLSGFLVKLSWELRWYMVGEEALRIREGLWLVSEQTMTIANIQNMIVRQGPLQRLFGVADLEVHTAGGGSGTDDDDDAEKKNSHVGVFRGLDDPLAVRDRIDARLSRQLGVGLGENEEVDGGATAAPELLAAASELLDEARALRSVLERGPCGSP